ncbi:dihydrofolate synthetase isoform X1 [Zea mays]|uniref:Dihydrofolate synthetase n=1 Tax=Zea mays TaxID=4577 RepID=A0A1D6MXE2_MAIZE|nr:dihydrofolate synthetase isoform X1 [Zea mays]ONM33397.1 Dihydrofolate synthetase [Zea mays]ONM33401.1 Dihydrofolate synthetase [Zea mays]ONM33402.1 Dihydrofolate synthetase [Zea mays]|eukprot:XP_008674354.1 dihydrofolate synthetase isoform X1 [Zea mays]
MLGHRFPAALGLPRGLLLGRSVTRRSLSAMAGGEAEGPLGGFFDYMERLRNYERSGVPRGAGTDSDDGFDLGRMRRLLRRLGDPHTDFPAVHIAGTKGKGSTAALLSNIMRAQGYNVGSYSSPHLLTIRERISVGNDGGPVPVRLLSDLFDGAKEAIDEAIELENGSLTHFEVFTALSFLLFSQENVDIAIIEAGLGGARDATNVIRSTELAASVITTVGREHLVALGGSLQSIAIAKSGIIKQGQPVVIGGPFSAVIEQIIRDRAFLTQSPVISACDPGIKSFTKCIDWDNGKPYQRCYFSINISNDVPLSIEMHDINLQLLGDHQRQNAVTAACTALCLRSLGWEISDASIQAGLRETQLPGRSQFLTAEEASVLGLDGASTVLIDGAHTEESAKALSGVIEAVRPEGPLALVVGMASDKEHLAFAEQLLSGQTPDVVLLTEASIAGGSSRAMPASSLKEVWIAAARHRGIEYVDIGGISGTETLEHIADLLGSPSLSSRRKPMVIGCQDMGPFSWNLIIAASQLLESRGRAPGLICVTGSLHLVGAILQKLGRH